MATPVVRVDLTGTKEITATLQRLGAEAPKVLAGALYRAGERIMTESKRRVPVDTGALRASGLVTPPETHGNAIVVELGYGGPAVNYAVHVHENLTARHTIGGPKYLEAPFLEASRTLAVDLARDLEAALRRMGR